MCFHRHGKRRRSTGTGGKNMTEICFTVRGVAVPQGSTKAFVVKGRAVTVAKTPALVAWRTAIADEARKVAPPALLEGAIDVCCQFAFERPKSRRKQGTVMYSRPDIDKLLRAVLDACTGVLWHDDAQVRSLYGRKIYESPPLLSVTVRSV